MSDQSSTPIKESQARGPGYLEVIFIGLILTALSLITYDRMFAQKVKVVDLQGYLRTQKILLTAGEITKSQWQANLDSIDEVLNQEAEAHPNHLIILNDVVLRNGDEISLAAQE